MREYDLLAGILAFQLRLVSAGTLAWYARTASEFPETRLLDFLADKGAIASEDWKLLRQITEELVRAHQGDAANALENFGGAAAAERAFARTVQKTAAGWETSEDDTIVASELPHGLPPQIVPESIGRYTRGSEYARGGIGRVLLVHDEQLGRDVILKELLPHRETSPTDPTLSRMPSPGSPMRQSAAMVSRFLQEARITGQLEHPSIVPVYELGLRKDGQLYYTMKLVRGNTLAVTIAACKNLDDRLGLLRFYLDVCHAVAYAHAKGVIHRDLKPSNIMVGEFGECVVLDWGLAKTQKDPDVHREAMEKTLSQLKLPAEHLEGLKTGSREVLGTPLYMAPEQARGEIDTVGYHSDVYSLGVLLFEILSGSLPHPWTNSHDTVRRVGMVPAPPVESVAPETPPELAAICNKALRFEPKDRYASARDLASDIERYLNGALVEAYAYRVSDVLRRLYRRHKPMIYTAALAILAILATGAISYANIYRARNAEVTARLAADEQRTIAESQRDEATAQRTRAEAAEEQTAREKYVSDIRLADAYIRDFKFQAAEDTLLAADPRFREEEWGLLLAQCHQDLATLSGHEDLVFEAFYTPDGQSIVTVSGDRSARLWSATTFETLYEWRYANSRIREAELDPTGERLAIALTDGSVRIINLDDGTEAYSLNAHSAPVNAARFSADGRQLVTGSSDRRAIIWDLESRKPIMTAPELSGEIKAAGFLNDGNRVFARTANGMLHLMDASNGLVLQTAPGIDTRSDDAGKLLAARSGNSAIVYAGDSLEPVLDLDHQAEVTSLALDFANDRILTGCDDGNLRLWRISDGTLERVFNLREPVKSCALSPDGRLVAAIAVNGLGISWDLQTGHLANRFSGHRGAVASITFSPDSTLLLTCGMDGTARLWHAGDVSLRKTIARQSGTELITHVIARNGVAALGSQHGTIDIYNFAARRIRHRVRLGETLWKHAIDLDKSGDKLVAVADAFLPVVLDLASGNVQARLHGHEGHIGSVGFNAAGTEIITASWDKTVRIWGASSGEQLAAHKAHDAPVTFACLSPSNELIGTAAEDNSAKVLSRDSGTVLLTAKHRARVVHCAFSPSSRLFATASDDGTAQIWDIESRTQIALLDAQMYGVAHVAFLNSDARLLTASEDRTVRIWDTLTGTELLSTGGFSDMLLGAGPGLQPGSLLVATRDGILSEIGAITQTASEPPLASAEALAPRVAILQEQSRDLLAADRQELEPPEVYVVMPEEALRQTLDAMRQRTSRDTDGAVDVTPALKTSLWRLGLQEGDGITAINGRVPDAASAAPSSTDNLYTADIVRNKRALRFRVMAMASLERSTNLNMNRDQAKAFLTEARKILAANTEAILQVSRGWAEDHNIPLENPDSIPGIVVNIPGPGIGQKMLETAGLQPLERIIEINEAPVTSLGQLIERCDAGIAYLTENEAYTLTFTIRRGGYETRTVTYTNEP